MKHVGFFDWNGKFHEADVSEVKKSDINPMFDTHIACVKMNDGTYFEIYSVDGELHGYIESI